MESKYVNYESIGTFALFKFVEFVIEKKKGLSKKERKLLFTRIDKYDILKTERGPEYIRKGLLRMAKALGGQKTFERYVKYRKKHKMI